MRSSPHGHQHEGGRWTGTSLAGRPCWFSAVSGAGVRRPRPHRGLGRRTPAPRCTSHAAETRRGTRTQRRAASRSSSRGGQARAAATAADCHPMVNANYVVFPKDSSCGSSAAGFKRVVRSPTTHTFGLCRRKLLPRRGLLRSLTRGCKRFCLSYRCSHRLVVRGLRTV